MTNLMIYVGGFGQFTGKQYINELEFNPYHAKVENMVSS